MSYPVVYHKGNYNLAIVMKQTTISSRNTDSIISRILDISKNWWQPLSEHEVYMGDRGQIWSNTLHTGRMNLQINNNCNMYTQITERSNYEKNFLFLSQICTQLIN